MWDFLEPCIKDGVMREKLFVLKETNNGYVIALKAINQKNSDIENIEVEFKLFVDYGLYKGHPRPKTKQEYTTARTGFLNSILKCKCRIPDGKFEKMSIEQLKHFDVQCKQHYIYFLFTCDETLKPEWPIGPQMDGSGDYDGGDDVLLGTSRSAPVSPSEGLDYASTSTVDNDKETRFLFNASTLPKSRKLPTIAKRRAQSVDCLQQICEDIGIEDDPSPPRKKFLKLDDGSHLEPAVSNMNYAQDCRNSPETELDGVVKVEAGCSSPQYSILVQIPEFSSEENILTLESNTTPFTLNCAEKDPPIDFITGTYAPMQKIDPDIFLNIEKGKEETENVNKDSLTPCGFNDEPCDLSWEDFCMDIPRAELQNT